jgi:hypothetical protein
MDLRIAMEQWILIPPKKGMSRTTFPVLVIASAKV